MQFFESQKCFLSVQLGLGCCFLFLSSNAWAQRDSFEGPPINYLTREVFDPVAMLDKAVLSGDVKLDYDREHGFLKSLLKALDIPVSSQVLVFSKTSLQLHHISPRHPRAIYFNDNVYIGWCFHGDVIELAATDEEQGAIFYTLKQSSVESNRFVRDRGQCLTCHASTRTQNVPGYFVRSVYPDKAGYPILGSGTFTTDLTSPFLQRWGGWYVTGHHGEMAHMGNRIYAEDESPVEQPIGQNRGSLEDFFSTDVYLAPHSDLVALMVLEHQTQMHNAITAASFETRQAVKQSFDMNDILHREEGLISESAQRRIDVVAEQVLANLLMCDEYRLESPVSGTSSFAKDFTIRDERDILGRSLREFDLETRLFKYPCSFLIYSTAFDRLPTEVRDIIITKLVLILTNTDTNPKYSHISLDSKRAILEILVDTKPLIQVEYERMKSR